MFEPSEEVQLSICDDGAGQPASTDFDVIDPPGLTSASLLTAQPDRQPALPQGISGLQPRQETPTMHGGPNALLTPGPGEGVRA